MRADVAPPPTAAADPRPPGPPRTGGSSRPPPAPPFQSPGPAAGVQRGGWGRGGVSLQRRRAPSIALLQLLLLVAVLLQPSTLQPAKRAAPASSAPPASTWLITRGAPARSGEHCCPPGPRVNQGSVRSETGTGGKPRETGGVRGERARRGRREWRGGGGSQAPGAPRMACSSVAARDLQQAAAGAMSQQAVVVAERACRRATLRQWRKRRPRAVPSLPRRCNWRTLPALARASWRPHLTRASPLQRQRRWSSGTRGSA